MSTCTRPSLGVRTLADSALHLRIYAPPCGRLCTHSLQRPVHVCAYWQLLGRVSRQESAAGATAARVTWPMDLALTHGDAPCVGPACKPEIC